MASKLAHREHRRRARKTLIEKTASMTPNEIAARLRASSDGFLLSPEWQAVRRQAMERYGCVCCKCGREGTARSPINFDHIKPRKHFPELALDIENLQPLCARCNKRKGNGPAVDYRGRDAATLALQRRIAQMLATEA